MAINKKGVYFTFLTIILITIMAFYLLVSSNLKFLDKAEVTGIRVSTMNNYIKSIELDLARGLYISTVRGVLSMDRYVAQNGLFLSDTESSIYELMENGTINSQVMPLMTASKISDWISRVKSKGLENNIITNFSNISYLVYQDDPWAISINISLNILINDTQNIASFYIYDTINTKIDIQRFEDPLYIVKTNGSLINTFNKTKYEGSYTPVASGLYNHVESQLYTTNPSAPSFLMRFEGNLSSSPYGIESFVNKQRLSAQGISVYQERSDIDYIYWGQNPVDGEVVAGMQPWFRIDTSHKARYGL